jgi:protein-S-isoprenylcysteine O-methyltransferase Ste14
MLHGWQLPALCIGLIVGFYWARVLKLVAKTRRQSGRAANFVPPEPLGRFLRIIWYPTVTLWVIVPLVTAFVTTRILLPVFGNLLISWLAVAVAFLALVLTMICWRKMGKSWRMGIDPAEKTPLVVSGPFAYVRHPIYALSSLLMLASVIAIPSWPMIVIGIIHLLFLQWEARREENHLINIHGDTYRDYMKQTGRFLPLPGKKVGA